MITSEFTDKDGFKLQFDETCTEIDKKFFREQYPKVDLVSNQRLHCTTCDIHIGTAPISEKIIRTHQVLGVTQCNKCFAFYVRNKNYFSFFSLLIFLIFFRTPASLGKVKMALSTTADGADKEVKFSAARHVHLFSATNAFALILLTRTSRRSRRQTTGIVSCATRTSCKSIVVNTGRSATSWYVKNLQS